MTTNLEIQNAKQQSKDYTINVDTGLSILVKSTGRKLWRFRYSFSGKRCMISLGKYPQISMKQAKAKQREYMDMLEQGINPSTHRQVQKVKLATEKDFRAVALEWYAKRYIHGKYQESKAIRLRLEKYLFPQFGKIPIAQIEPPMMYNLVEAIQEQGYIETGQRVNTYASMIFRYGVAKGYCKQDITQHYKGMLSTAPVKHMPTLTDEGEIGELLRDIHSYHGTIIVKTAFLISAYIFVRPSELANSKWDFIDFEKSHWLIPARLMKMKRDHLIPFPKQVKILLENLLPITGESEHVFPSERDSTRSMNSQTVNKTLRVLNGGKYLHRMVSHGFRGMASTILNEHKFRSEVIEKQLAHQERNKIRGAYNHAEYLEERSEMMQWYADYLDGLRDERN